MTVCSPFFRIAGVALFLLSTAAYAQEKASDRERSACMDPATIRAFEALGAKYGLLAGPPTSFDEKADPNKTREGWPAFQFSKALPKELPEVKVPFGLLLEGEALNDESMKRLEGTKMLHALHLYNGICPPEREWRKRLTDLGLKAVASCEELVVLALVETDVTDKGLEQLAALKKLSALSIEARKISDATLSSLRKARLLHALTNPNFIRPASPKPLANTPERVLRLDLTGSAVTDLGVKEIVQISSIRWLSLSGTAVTDEGLRELAALKELSYLELFGTKVSETGLAAFRRALPECEVLAKGDR